MRARLIVNPKSGADRAPLLLPAINERLRTFVTDLDITITTGEADIVRAASRAVHEQCDILFIAGGDGTINAAVRTVAALPGGLERLAFGVIPAGTGNDFAKALDLGEEPERAVERLLDARAIDVDLGTLNDRAFCNSSAGGFIADVSALLTEELKDLTGKLAYVIGGARALFGREPFTTELRVPDEGMAPPDETLYDPAPREGARFGRTDAATVSDTRMAGLYAPPAGALDLQLFAVCNARFIGGGYPLAPGALIDDGLVDVFLVRRTPLLEFAAVLQKIAAGQHEVDSRVLHFRARELELAFDRLVHVNTDGEVLEARRCVYRVLPRAARFLCGPAPLSAAAPRPLMV